MQLEQPIKKPTPGLVVGGRYRLERPLATGGMGSLWVARHAALDVDVALKLMNAHLAAIPEAKVRFEREAKLLAAMRSAHIVHVHDYGVDDGLPYLVMELLHGEDLGARLDRVRRLDVGETKSLLAQIAKGLRRAHEAGLVHRDLKPSNVFLALVDGEESAKIVDFGAAKDLLAKVTGESTRTGELLGSPQFMSPEQLRGARAVDLRADLWSLAVILYRALTGVLPFPAADLGSLVEQVLTDPIPPPSRFALELPDAIDVFFHHALARQADARFQSVRDMVRAFDEAFEEAPEPRSQRVGVKPIAPSSAPPPAIESETTMAAPIARALAPAALVDPPKTTANPAEIVRAPRASGRGRARAASIGVAVGLALGITIAPSSRREAHETTGATASAVPSPMAAPPTAIVEAPGETPQALATATPSAAPPPSAPIDRNTPAKVETGSDRWGF